MVSADRLDEPFAERTRHVGFLERWHRERRPKVVVAVDPLRERREQENVETAALDRPERLPECVRRELLEAVEDDGFPCRSEEFVGVSREKLLESDTVVCRQHRHRILVCVPRRQGGVRGVETSLVVTVDDE